MDIGAYKAKIDNLSHAANRLGNNASKIDFRVDIDTGGSPASAFVMPIILSILLVVGALVGLTVWLV